MCIPKLKLPRNTSTVILLSYRLTDVSYRANKETFNSSKYTQFQANSHCRTFLVLTAHTCRSPVRSALTETAREEAEGQQLQIGEQD